MYSAHYRSFDNALYKFTLYFTLLSRNDSYAKTVQFDISWKDSYCSGSGSTWLRKLDHFRNVM